MDVKIVFSYLEEKSLNKILHLSFGGQVMNTVFNFEVNKMFINTEGGILPPNTVLKHSKPGRELDQFTYRSFPQKELSVADALQKYLTCRKLRVGWNIKNLFITLKAHHHEARIYILRR